MIERYDHPFEFEPLLIGDARLVYKDLIEMVGSADTAAIRLESFLPQQTLSGLAKFVSGMNCYYSNLIG